MFLLIGVLVLTTRTDLAGSSTTIIKTDNFIGGCRQSIYMEWIVCIRESIKRNNLVSVLCWRIKLTVNDRLVGNWQFESGHCSHPSQSQTQNFQQRKQKKGKKVKVVICSHTTLLSLKFVKKSKPYRKVLSLLIKIKPDHRTASHMTAIPPDHDSL